MDNFKVLVTKESETYAPDKYILLTYNPDGVSIYLDCNITDLLVATMVVYDELIKEALQYTDQELYEACKVTDTDYDSLMELVREARNNG